MASLEALYRVWAHLVLCSLSLTQVYTFIRLSSLLKNDIQLAQPVTVAEASIPGVLPPSIATFLSRCIGILEGLAIAECWSIFKEEAWAMPNSTDTHKQDEDAFCPHGWKHGITLMLYPPHQHCTNADCVRTTPLKKEES